MGNRHHARLPTLLGILAWTILTSLASGQNGGGGPPVLDGPCVPLREKWRIESEVSSFLAANPQVAAAPLLQTQRYPFYPQGGKLWEDIFPNNFVDVDTTAGSRDYNGSGYTYNGHTGIDSDLCTFTEQAIGVPVFAVLDGTVTTAHDGEFDSRTTWVAGATANYVAISHGGGHRTLYYHLKKGSVAVTAGQKVKAGQQIGLTASSGYSTGPHLHFESQLNNVPYDPFSGSANPRDSGWADQPVFRATTYVRDLNITTQNLATWTGPPTDTTRTGTIGSGLQNPSFWVILQNLPASSTYRVRYLRRLVDRVQHQR